MATSAKLQVEITSNSTKLTKGLTSARQKIGAFAQNAAQKLKSIGLVVGTAVIAATALVIRALSQMADKIDELAKAASAIGSTVKELQKLQLVAKLAGVGIEDMNTSLQKMQRNLADAADGTGEAGKGLEKLGLDAKALVALSPSKQFEAIATAMKKVSSSTERTQIAMQLFGRSGGKLINALLSDVKGIGDEFDSLGLGLTDAQAKAVESFNDSSTKLNAIWENFKMQITANIAPALEIIVQHVTDFIKEMGGIKAVALSVSVSMVNGIIAIIEAVDTLAASLDGVRILYEAVGLAAVKLNPLLDKNATIGQEDRLGSAIDAAANRGQGAASLKSLVAKLEAEQALIGSAQRTQSVSSNAGSKATTNTGGFGSITDVTTGRTVTTGQQRSQIDVNITTDKEGIVNAVVTNKQFDDSVNVKINQATKDAARAVGR